MRALSLWQPWASLWCSESKVHETRHWATSYTGWLAVHAAKRIEVCFNESFEQILHHEFGAHWATELPRGMVIGAVQITACVSTDLARPFSVSDRECGNWSGGRFGFRRDLFVVLPAPIPFRGQQGFFDIPDWISAQIEELVK